MWNLTAKPLQKRLSDSRAILIGLFADNRFKSARDARDDRDDLRQKWEAWPEKNKN